MTKIPENLKYTKDHEWVNIENGVATIGITDFAQSQLGDIVFVELPDAGSTYEKDAAFGVVESIKSVSDLYLPISGEVLEKNEALEDTPELCNTNPYESWMVKIKMSKTEESNELLDPSSYLELCNS